MEAINHIEIVDDVPLIAGRWVKVKMVANMYLKAGATIEQIMEQYDLTPAEVHAALAYYYDHQADFEAEEQRIAPLVKAAEAETAQKLARMLARRDAGQ